MNIKSMTVGVITLAGLSAALQGIGGVGAAQAGTVKPIDTKTVAVVEHQAELKVLAESGTLPQAAAPAPQTVTVQQGDILVRIATDHQTTYTRLFDANPQIADPDVINPGEVIRIPSADEQLAARPLPTDAPQPVSQPVAVQQQVSQAAPAPAPAPAPARQAAAAPAVAGGSTWDRLAQCESSGNWAINTGNGYYGGLQFNLATWQSNGGSAYAAYPHQATREQQIAIASKVAAGRGFAPWPACAAKLGLL